MNTVASPGEVVAPPQETAPPTDQPSTNPLSRTFDLLSSQLVDGVTPLSLGISALAAFLAGFGSSGVVAQQASYVIAFVVLVGIQLAVILWHKRSPARLRVDDTRDANAIHPLTAYLSTRRAGTPSVGANQPEREGEVKTVTDMITGDANVSILYGDPGNGKTSLVHGAVIPELESNGWHVWYVASPDRDPIGTLSAAAVAQGADAAGAPKAAGTVDWPAVKAMVQAAQSHDPGLVIVFDHVQRLLLRTPGGPVQDPFWAQLAEVVGSSVRMLLICRTDTLPQAIQALGVIDSSLDEVPQHELTPFTPEQAFAALAAVAAASGLPLEERLAHRVVQDLTTDNQVSPAQLQLVLDTLFWNGIVTLPSYVRHDGARGAELRYFATRWRDRVQDRGGDPDAQLAVLAHLAAAEPEPGTGRARAGLAVDQLGASDAVLNGLYTDHLVERLRSGNYRLAEPGLASALRAPGVAEARSGRGRAPGGARAQLAAAGAWCGHLPRMGLALVLAGMVSIVGMVMYLIVAGYPQGRMVASLPVVVSAGSPSLDLVAFDQQGQYLAGDAGDQILVWDLRNPRGNLLYRTLSKAAIDPSFVTRYLSFVEPDEVRLYGVDGQVWGWQLSTGNFIRQDENAIASDSKCTVSAATVNSTGRLLAEGTQCGELRVLDVDAKTQVNSFNHHDPKCSTLQLAFSRAENQLLEFFRCKSSNDVLQLRAWPLTQSQAGGDLSPSINGTLVKVEYLPDGNPYVLTVTQAETHLWEMASSLARSRWPLAVYDGAPTDLAPDGRVLAVGFAGEIRLYERAEWPFGFIPVKDSAKGLFDQSGAASASAPTTPGG